MIDRTRQTVLIVDDDPEATHVVLEAMAVEGISGVVVNDRPEAFEKIDEEPWDMILADLEFLGDDVWEFVRRTRLRLPETPVVMASERGSVPQAVRAMRAGCEEFLVKPVGRKNIAAVLEMFLPSLAPVGAKGAAGPRERFPIIARSARFLATLAAAAKVAGSSLPVLVTGESGTGKELISCFIHGQSRRAGGPYVRVNCAALSESLLESELFGHERGAFTGAHCRRKGLFERAHGGTLLLDEISETPPRFQAELLRVLDQQDFQRVGGSEPVQVNVRVISTSNRDLAAEVAAGRFRQDLYYRLCGLHLCVPPLRERIEDIEPLTWHFVNQAAREVRRRVTSIRPGALRRLCQYSWPGNVRQLRNVVQAALVMGQGEQLALDGAARLEEPPAASDSASSTLSLRDLERQAILEALRRTRSHHAKAAGLLGITDRTLREKLRRYRRDGAMQPAGDKNRWLTETA